MGSVKDLRYFEMPTAHTLGTGEFNFSDRFSVFDWGEMPDEIPGKGAALCMMAAWNFEQLAKIGVPNHYVSVIDPVRQTNARTNELSGPSNMMVVRLANLFKPEFLNGDYSYEVFSHLSQDGKNFVVPLEVIYRRGAPEGSSLLRKFDRMQNEGDAEGLRKLLAKYELREPPFPGQLFPKAGVDFTTKFESTGDRELTDEEAYQASGLTRDNFRTMLYLAEQVVGFVGERAREVGMVDYDGKHEYVFDGRGSIMLADVAGTLDENRFMLDGTQVSKEFLRQVYRREQPEWINAIAEAKAEAKARGVEDWKILSKVQPKELDPNLIKLVGEMYTSASDRYTGLNLFKSRPLEIVMQDLKPYLGTL